MGAGAPGGAMGFGGPGGADGAMGAAGAMGFGAPPSAHEILTDDVGDSYNSVFKCQRYASDYPGLQGKDLTPMGTLTEIFDARD
jgi:hypothetical protein